MEAQADLIEEASQGGQDMKIGEPKANLGTGQERPDTRIYTDKSFPFPRKGASLFLGPDSAIGGSWSSFNPALGGLKDKP